MNQTSVEELSALSAELKKMRETLAENNDSFFMCTMALIIFLMQCGFAFLEAGAVRSKNTTNIIIKNVLDSLLGIIGYWLVGWALAYGPNPSPALEPFFGFSEFCLHGNTTPAKFFFHFVFAATAATIISGAVAERCEFLTFVTYSVTVTSFTYPVLTHWGWSSKGWMAAGLSLSDDQLKTTYVDFAGSGMVHLTGGTISLLAAFLMGPRLGRFVRDRYGQRHCVEIKGHSVPFAALGGFILMFGFLAFNGGSIAEISSAGAGPTVARVMINTILCGAFAALSYLLIHYYRRGKWTVLLTINACLTGMVAACAGCNLMPSWATVLVGSGAGLVYLAMSEFCLNVLHVDDPLDAFAVHFGGGLWGLISACIFTEKGLLIAALTGQSVVQPLAQLGWQLVCALAIITWSLVTLAPPLLLLKLFGRLRVSEEVEVKGIDIFMHGEAAYPLIAYGHGWGEFDNIRKLSLAAPPHSTNGSGGGGHVAKQNAVGKPQQKDASSSVYFKNPQYFEHPEHNHLAQNAQLYRRVTTAQNGVSIVPVTPDD